jgi:hypothetical protein
MRPDQVARLTDLSEKLADTFLTEADPGEWAGGDKLPADLTQQERGDRYWCKKNAMATGGVLRYTLDLLVKHVGEQAPEDDADMDRKIRDAEKRAAKAVNDAISRAKKPIVTKKG